MIKTLIGIVSPDRAITCTIARSNIQSVGLVAPKVDNIMASCLRGIKSNVSAKCLEMKERCVPSSNNILASAIVELCFTGAIPVLSKVVVLGVGKRVPAVRVFKDGGVTEISLVESRATLWLTGMSVTGGVGIAGMSLCCVGKLELLGF